jgi:hypothetical protein
MRIHNLLGSYSRRRFCALMVSSLFAGCLLFTASCPSWAIEAVALDHSSAALSAVETSPLTSNTVHAGDPCRSLLGASARQASPVSAMDHDRQSAGTAAAVGLVLGIHFALGPKEVTGPRRSSVSVGLLQARDTGGMQALAISQYRRCRNEQALQSLKDLRWSR